MRGKLLLVAGLATGYVLGSKAGRKRYEQISKISGSFWNSRPVQSQVHKVEDFAKDKAPEVVDFVGGTVKKLVGGSPSKSTSASSSRTTPARRNSTKNRTSSAGSSSTTE